MFGHVSDVPIFSGDKYDRRDTCSDCCRSYAHSHDYRQNTDVHHRVVGSTIAALQAGIPLYGVDPVTIKSLLIGGLNPVLIDMGGILLFICIMQSTGFLHVIIGDIIKADNYIGGGPGIITAAAAVAGGIGMMVGFTQAAITGVVAGPAAIKLGVDKNEAAGALQHANILGCGAGFSHPTVRRHSGNFRDRLRHDKRLGSRGCRRSYEHGLVSDENTRPKRRLCQKNERRRD